MLPLTASNPDEAIRTQDVTIPALMVLGQAKRLGVQGLTSHQVCSALEKAMSLSREDREKLSDRTTRFSRTVRNSLVSHQVLTRAGLARESREDDDIRVRFDITPKGQGFLFDHMLGVFKAVLPPVETLVAVEPSLHVVEGAPRAFTREVEDIALLALALAQDANEGKAVSPTHVRRVAKGLPTLQVAPEDARPLPSHPAGRMDRTLRNITASHDTLVKNGHARRTKDGLKITLKGKAHLLNTYLLRFLPSPPILEEARAKANASAAVAPESSQRPGRRSAP